jgi:hypothetical protein
VPEHRDFVLSAQEHEANDRMMICCSGARTPASTWTSEPQTGHRDGRKPRGLRKTKAALPLWA